MRITATLTFAFAVAASAAGAVIAASAARAQQGRGETLNAPYTTQTGETVPNPGKSQSGGPTSLDRGIQRQDNKIDGSICKGC